ncbi:heme exporter protein CcmB [Rheinheimera sp.]|uniref:heme exporter protein CcmB n=1 Tax=Rheinheimera sp. TaxID=1869214 RepID=UPI0027B90E8E|nr:heme exporter protein CcmB [Rheinheimera sp.]
MVMFKAAFVREWRLLARQKADWLNPLMFFVIVLTLFPLGIGAKPNLLAEIAPGIIWIAALLSVLLGAERLFKEDFRQGTLEQLVAADEPLFAYVLAKITSSWCSTALPLLFISPLIALLLGLNAAAWQAIVLSLLLGTPLLNLLAALGAALTLSADKGGILLALLILPLYIPLLIFASAAVDNATLGLDYSAQLAVLAAMLCLAAALVPLAVLKALRLNVG